MQYEIFTIPVFNPEEGIEKLNRFLRGHKVVQVDKEIVRMGALRHFMKGCCIMAVAGTTTQGTAVCRIVTTTTLTTGTTTTVSALSL